MKRKLTLLLLATALSISSVGCGGASSSEEQSTPKTESEIESTEENTESDENVVKEEISNTSCIDGVTVTITGSSIEDYEDSNGEYDRRIIMYYTIKNDTDTAFGYSTMGWSAYMQDGYKLQTYSDIMKDLSLNQVPSHSETAAQVSFLVSKGVNVTDFLPEYVFFDYNEEFWDDFGKVMNGEMQENEYKEKYGNSPIMKFKATVDQQ